MLENNHCGTDVAIKVIKATIMKRLHLTETSLDEWWRHNGVADRIQASGMYCYDDIQTYLAKTDDWWFSRTYEEKVEIYEDFFSEV